MLANSSYNPDVLSCLANLSSDEVFTPPQLANRILDMLPAELWSDKKAKFATESNRLIYARHPSCFATFLICLMKASSGRLRWMTVSGVAAHR